MMKEYLQHSHSLLYYYQTLLKSNISLYVPKGKGKNKNRAKKKKEQLKCFSSYPSQFITHTRIYTVYFLPRSTIFYHHPGHQAIINSYVCIPQIVILSSDYAEVNYIVIC